MASTLLLDIEAWDLLTNPSGDIAVESGADALAQDAASAIRLFAGELWFDTTQGIPYFAKILSYRPPLALMKAYFVAAAKTVPGVVSAVCFITTLNDRGVSGQVQITDSQGNQGTASF